MTAAEVCDVAYVLMRDSFKEQALADRQALIASGRVSDLGRLPTVTDELERFDSRLEAAPAVSKLSVEEYELRQALGVL